MTERNWQEDMNGCTGLPPTPWAWVETDIGEWIEDSNQEIVIGSEDEYIFDDLLGPNVKKEAFMRFMINAPEALPYWLQQYAALEREYERFQQVAKGWNDDLTTAEERHAAADRDRAGAYKALEQAESLIQQKDAEIAELKESKRFELIRRIREKADKDTYALAEECVRLDKELAEANVELARLTKVIKDANDENEHTLNGVGMEEYESALTELLYKE